MPFNLFRAARFITVFKEWLCLLSCTNRICFRGYHSQQFSSYNSVGSMCSSKYLWWNLSNSPGTSTLIYWETLAGMQPQIAPQSELLTAEVIEQLKHHTGQRPIPVCISWHQSGCCFMVVHGVTVKVKGNVYEHIFIPALPWLHHRKQVAELINWMWACKRAYADLRGNELSNPSSDCMQVCVGL